MADETSTPRTEPAGRSENPGRSEHSGPSNPGHSPSGHTGGSSSGYQGHSSGPRPAGAGRPAGPGGPGGGGRKFFRRKKVCKFCTEKIDAIPYREVRLLQQFVAERGKIVPRRLTGVCTTHQRKLTRAIKQARNIALLPFAARF
ncbi:SSU ribosomal protein S18p [Acidisarcina polymorpha]|uniref:Small ribosomal subunit protein bS18 n=1 Tax=Acidisarcina polymorpha TaxID=2211140 RepID=A0A2Z5FW81_9BACT|nr:30S ribosomal protein S18 [Acidisarcina polymorpha]AXC11022.1 SSU ribosomal protein S18p [Acidisarcina polymorpha]